MIADLTAIVVFIATILCTITVIVGVIALVQWLFRLPLRSKPFAPRQSLPPAPAKLAPQPTPRPSPDVPYVRAPHLITPAEQEFMRVLRAAAPDGTVIYPQVRLPALIRPARQPARGKQPYDFYRIQAKSVDFVLCEASTSAPLLIVELDDSSHRRPDRQERDAFVDAALASAGLPVLHVRWQRGYDPLMLAAQINALLAKAPPAQLPPVPVPIPVAPAQPSPPPIVPVPVQGPAIVCGRCQSPVLREARFCANCGTTLAAMR